MCRKVGPGADGRWAMNGPGREVWAARAMAGGEKGKGGCTGGVDEGARNVPSGLPKPAATKTLFGRDVKVDDQVGRAEKVVQDPKQLQVGLKVPSVKLAPLGEYLGKDAVLVGAAVLDSALARPDNVLVLAEALGQ